MLQDHIAEFMKPIDNDPAKTTDTKREILFHVKQFAAFVEAKENPPAKEPVEIKADDPEDEYPVYVPPKEEPSHVE